MPLERGGKTGLGGAGNRGGEEGGRTGGTEQGGEKFGSDMIEKNYAQFFDAKSIYPNNPNDRLYLTVFVQSFESREHLLENTISL